jgi:uncharacterized protein
MLHKNIFGGYKNRMSPTPYSPSFYRTLLEQHISDEGILTHCVATQSKAIYIAQQVAQYLPVDISLVSAGALLHDIGRSETHDVTHGAVGGRILSEEGCPVTIIRVVERHVLGGFTANEASLIGLPNRSFLPVSLEERIVCVADKLGVYHWRGIDILSGWIPKIQERFSELRRRYGVVEPYLTSMQRVKEYATSIIRTISVND